MPPDLLMRRLHTADAERVQEFVRRLSPQSRRGRYDPRDLSLGAFHAEALIGVALVSSMQDALEKAFGGAMRFGALAAFVVAVSPFSLLAERAQLVDFWLARRRTLA